MNVGEAVCELHGAIYRTKSGSWANVPVKAYDVEPVNPAHPRPHPNTPAECPECGRSLRFKLAPVEVITPEGDS